ncbi:MAG: DDE-type integrase/transposase/recombinase, partial [Planctomycetes bacterium]|nr:DDE-type integrase/transposase/recombinase [Planctomycetota bacterium]
SGWAYLVAVMDWHSRCVLSWRLSNSMDASFCVEALEEALRNHGKPEIFNTDQGSQFTGEDFLGVLEKREILISMDGKGRALDNVFIERLWRSLKYEEVFIKDYQSMADARNGIAGWINFYNTERPHAALCYKTPIRIYQNVA